MTIHDRIDHAIRELRTRGSQPASVVLNPADTDIYLASPITLARATGSTRREQTYNGLPLIEGHPLEASCVEGWKGNFKDVETLKPASL